jgi:PAS domain S-box-containing protein
MSSIPQTYTYHKNKTLHLEESKPDSLLTHNQDMLNSMLQDVPVAMLICNSQAIITASNSEAAQLLKRNDLVGKRLLNLFERVNYLDGSEFTSQECPIQVAISQQRRIANVMLQQCGSHAEENQRLFLNAAPKFSPDGTVQYVVCSLQEVSHFEPVGNPTASLFIQKTIHQAQKEWRSTVDALSELIFLESPDGRLLRCNKAAAEFLQLSYREILSKNLIELFFGSTPGAAFQNPFHRGKSEVQFPGREGWYEVISYEISRDQGLSAGWVHIILDITSHKNATAKLHQLDTVIEQTAEAILIADSTGIIQYVNPAYETITGWSREQATGRHFLTLGGQTAKLSHYRDAADALSSGRPWRSTDIARRKDGTPYEEEITISPVRNSDGKLLNYVAVSRDITEKKRLESIAEAVNMMENVGYVFSGIRHELGNPINSVKTALSVLIRNIEQWPQSQVIKYLHRTLSEIGRVEYLLQVLKTFSFHENPNIQNLHLIPFLKKFFSLVESDFTNRGIRIVSSLDTNLSWCKADPRALHQVLLNILANAADALVDRDNPTIAISLAQVGSMVNIKITDNGIGMDKAQQENLFKPFYTSKASGTGLGLVIVKKMMVKMNGMISIRSEHQVGTEVSLMLEEAQVQEQNNAAIITEKNSYR